MPANNRVATYTETIRVRIAPDQLEKLYLICSIKECSISSICRKAISAYLQEISSRNGGSLDSHSQPT